MTDLTLSSPGVAGDERPAGPRRSVRVPYLIGAAALVALMGGIEPARAQVYERSIERAW